MREFWVKDEDTKITYLDWVNPGYLKYDQVHMEWILPYLFYLCTGFYPKEPSGGYEEFRAPGRRAVAPYENACQIAAEIDLRLAHVGVDRYMVEDHYCRQLDYYEIAKKLCKDAWEIERTVKSAFIYISSGQCHRWVECSGCVYFEKCRKKKKLTGAVIDYKEWIRRGRK